MNELINNIVTVGHRKIAIVFDCLKLWIHFCNARKSSSSR